MPGPARPGAREDETSMRLLAIALTAVLIVASVVGMVGAFALLARRLLGLRFGLVRLLVAGLVGFAVAGAIAGPWPGRCRGMAAPPRRCGS